MKKVCAAHGTASRLLSLGRPCNVPSSQACNCEKTCHTAVCQNNAALKLSHSRAIKRSSCAARADYCASSTIMPALFASPHPCHSPWHRIMYPCYERQSMPWHRISLTANTSRPPPAKSTRCRGRSRRATPVKRHIAQTDRFPPAAPLHICFKCSPKASYVFVRLAQ